MRVTERTHKNLMGSGRKGPTEKWEKKARDKISGGVMYLLLCATQDVRVFSAVRVEVIQLILKLRLRQEEAGNLAEEPCPSLRASRSSSRSSHRRQPLPSSTEENVRSHHAR